MNNYEDSILNLEITETKDSLNVETITDEKIPQNAQEVKEINSGLPSFTIANEDERDGITANEEIDCEKRKRVSVSRYVLKK